MAYVITRQLQWCGHAMRRDQTKSTKAAIE